MSTQEDEPKVGPTVAEADADVLVSPELEDEATEEAQIVTPDTDTTEEEQATEVEVEDDAEVLVSSSPEPEDEAVEEAQVVAADTDTTEEEEQETETVEAVAEVTQPQAEEAVEESAAEPQDNRAWYVVHCYSGHENKVKHNLEQRTETMRMQDEIFQVVVPTEDEIEVRDGRRRMVERRVFPGYILVQMILTDDSWYVVRNTPGVTGFVGMGNVPTPLRPEEVQAIMRRMEAEAPRIRVTFKSGQKVRIIDGPFNEFIGVVDEIDMERAKVRVLVSFFGRETPVELDFLQVEKA